MMKKMKNKIGVICIILLALCGLGATRSGNFFNIVASGAPGSVSITLCLNGKGPLSCQNYTVSALTLSINTTVSNHTYPYAGIIVNTPGYTLTGCSPFNNGYCLFTVSNATPTNIVISSTTSNLPSYFYATTGFSTITFCQPNSNGTLSGCFATGSGFVTPVGVILNAAHTFAYIVNAGSSSNLSSCAVATNGALSACSIVLTALNGGLGIAINPAGTTLYVSKGINDIVYCALGNNGTLSNCNTSGLVTHQPTSITVNPAGTLIYASDINSGLITYCPLNGNGSINTSGCLTTGSGFVSPTQIAFNPAGTFLYIADSSNSNTTITYCSVNVNGSLGACAQTGSEFDGPFGVAINHAGTFAYVTNVNNDTGSVCAINGNGTLSSCMLATTHNLSGFTKLTAF